MSKKCKDIKLNRKMHLNNDIFIQCLRIVPQSQESGCEGGGLKPVSKE
jgi:hypothetical protein